MTGWDTPDGNPARDLEDAATGPEDMTVDRTLDAAARVYHFTAHKEVNLGQHPLHDLIQDALRRQAQELDRQIMELVQHGATNVVRYLQPGEELVGTIRERIRPAAPGSWVKERFLAPPSTVDWFPVDSGTISWDATPSGKFMVYDGRRWKPMREVPDHHLTTHPTLDQDSLRLARSWTQWPPAPPTPWRPRILTEEPRRTRPVVGRNTYLLERAPRQETRPDQRPPRRKDRIHTRMR